MMPEQSLVFPLAVVSESAESHDASSTTGIIPSISPCGVIKFFECEGSKTGSNRSKHIIYIVLVVVVHTIICLFNYT